MNYMLNIMYSIDNQDELSLPLSYIKFINIFLKNVAEMPLVQQVYYLEAAQLVEYMKTVIKMQKRHIVGQRARLTMSKIIVIYSDILMVYT